MNSNATWAKMATDRTRVYFAAGTICGRPLIKIGASGDIRARVRALRSATRADVVFLGYLADSGFADERQLHDRFAHLRIAQDDEIPHSTEWYHDEGEIRAYVEAFCKTDGYPPRSREVEVHPSGLLNVQEAAAKLILSADSVRQMIKNGHIRCAQLPGGQYRIPASEVDRLLAVKET